MTTSSSDQKSRLDWMLLPIPFLFFFYHCCRSFGSGAPVMHMGTILRHVVSTHVDVHNITMLTGWLFALLPFGEMAFQID
jgi:hypothetical protein